MEGGEGRVRDNLLNGMTCVAGGATSTTRGVERFAVSTSDEMTTAGWGTPLVILKRWTARRLALTMRDRESFAVRTTVAFANFVFLCLGSSPVRSSS